MMIWMNRSDWVSQINATSATVTNTRPRPNCPRMYRSIRVKAKRRCIKRGSGGGGAGWQEEEGNANLAARPVLYFGSNNSNTPITAPNTATLPA